MASIPTRSATSNTSLIDLVGTGKEFIPSEAPTLRAVIRKGIQIQEQNLHNNIARLNYPINSIACDLADVIIAQWKKSNIDFKFPVIKHENTLRRNIENKWKLLCEVARGKAPKKKRQKLEMNLTNYLTLPIASAQSIYVIMKKLNVVDAD